jgi:hypothetical protein
MQAFLSRAGAARGIIVRTALALAVFTTAAGPASALSEGRKFVGNPNSAYNFQNLAVCAPAPASDWVSQRFMPGIMQGYFRLDYTLYKDGQKIVGDRQDWDETGSPWLQNYTFTHVFPGIATTPGKYTTELTIRKRNGPPWNRDFNEHVLVETSPPLVISNVQPVPKIKIRNAGGIFVDPPADGSAIPVSLSAGIVMDASATTCSTGYEVIVQESNAQWDRPVQHEWQKWFTGPAPAALNLQQLTTTYSASDGTGYFSLLGGNFTAATPGYAGQARYYRVGIAPAGGQWVAKQALIQVAW